MKFHLRLNRTLLALGMMAAATAVVPGQQNPTPQANPNPQPGVQSNQQSTTPRSSNPADPAASKTTPRSTATSSEQTPTATQPTATQTGTARRTETASPSTELMVGPDDQKFLIETAQAGMMEVQAAQLAQQKAESEEVKQLAKQLEQEHSKANEQLKALAQQKNVSLPSDIGPKHQNHLSKLQNLSGAQFDKAYLKMQADHHKRDVKAFQRHSERSMDSDVKEFASKTLPSLQQHLQQVQQVNETGTRARKAPSPGESSSTSSSDSSRSTSSTPTGTTESGSDATKRPQGQNNPTKQP